MQNKTSPSEAEKWLAARQKLRQLEAEAAVAAIPPASSALPASTAMGEVSEETLEAIRERGFALK